VTTSGKNSWFKALVSGFLLAVILGCGPDPERIRGIIGTGQTNVVTTIPIAREFRSTFTNCEISIANTLEKRPYRRNVQLKADLFDRYIVYLNLAVEFVSPTKLEVLSHVVEGFYVSEVTSISKAANGNTQYDFGESFRFGEKEWGVLKTNGLHFRAIGITLKTNAPVKGFREAINGARATDW
jgi:hypothetical protein